jgi:hypothetical protein
MNDPELSRAEECSIRVLEAEMTVAEAEKRVEELELQQDLELVELEHEIQ